MISIAIVRIPSTRHNKEIAAKKKYEKLMGIKLIRFHQKNGEPDYYHKNGVGTKFYVEVKHQGEGLSRKQLLWIMKNNPRSYTILYSYSCNPYPQYQRRPRNIPEEVWKEMQRKAREVVL